LKLACLLCALLLPGAGQAQFDYTTNNGTITFTGYTGAGGAVTIPAKINGLPVTGIGEGAFAVHANWKGTAHNKSKGRLTSVTIPDSVTNIGSHAFTGCSSLTRVTIPTGVTSIGWGMFSGCRGLANIKIPNSITSIEFEAFTGCSGLTDIAIPDSVTNIGDWAFSACTSLRAITVDARNPIYGSVDGVLFDKNHATLIQFPSGKTGGYAIPNGVTGVGQWAFSKCDNLTSVIIPDRNLCKSILNN